MKEEAEAPEYLRVYVQGGGCSGLSYDLKFDNAKEGCVFINVGRGPIVDEPAMVEALKDGRLKGAGLDVFTQEPLEEESELWTLDNVLLSP